MLEVIRYTNDIETKKYEFMQSQSYKSSSLKPLTVTL